MIHVRYLGGKSRLAKDIVPIIQKYADGCACYCEPFMGGANIADKIKHDNIICYDNNKYLIALYKMIPFANELFPKTITYEMYEKVKANKDKYEDWMVGLAGFCASYSGKFFGGYARHFHGDNSGNLCAGSIKNLLLQKDFAQRATLICKDFREINEVPDENVCYYADPPYKDTTGYTGDAFQYEEFYDWCREKSKLNTVIISEYWMPEDFTEIWSADSKIVMHSNGKQNRIEKLFMVRHKQNIANPV